MNYNITIPKYTELEKKIQNERDFFPYMRLLEKAKSDHLIMVTVQDTPAGPLTNTGYVKSMMNALGLQLDMQYAYRQPYIAIINNGEVLYEQTSKDLTKALKVNLNINGHNILVFSGGYECAEIFKGKAYVIVDKNSPLYGGRGFNFYTYNTEKNYMVDLYHLETYQNTAIIPFSQTLLREKKLYSVIENISPKLGGGGICLYDFPQFPQTNFSPQEKIMFDSTFRFENMLANEKLMKDIWNRKLFHFCNDFSSMEDLKEAISTPDSYEDLNGVLKLKDHTSNVVNTRNGIRVTANQPKEHKRAVFLVGGCGNFGIGADDSHTVASFLQRKFNELMPSEGFIVYNYGFYASDDSERLLPVLLSLPIKKGDIVLFNYLQFVGNMPFCNLRYKARRPHNYGDIFLDPGHLTASGYKMTADGMFEFLEQHDFFRNATMTITKQNKDTIDDRPTIAKENALLTKYKQELAEFYKENIMPKVGAIVMNANPFTYGHRYLVEEALKECDFLIVFVVEEDKSLIPFKDRFALVKENLMDLPKVFVKKSGEFIISSKTFSEYFVKESLQDQKIDTTLDVTLFAEEIAPSLNISVRFAGSEPTDSVTRQYNEDMAKILPQYGINFKELERAKTDKGDIISASTVRKLVASKEFDKLKQFAPPATIKYLKKKYA